MDWPEEAPGRLLGLGGDAEILDPPAAREQLIQLASGALARNAPLAEAEALTHVGVRPTHLPATRSPADRWMLGRDQPPDPDALLDLRSRSLKITRRNSSVITACLAFPVPAYRVPPVHDRTCQERVKELGRLTSIPAAATARIPYRQCALMHMTVRGFDRYIPRSDGSRRLLTDATGAARGGTPTVYRDRSGNARCWSHRARPVVAAGSARIQPAAQWPPAAPIAGPPIAPGARASSRRPRSS